MRYRIVVLIAATSLLVELRPVVAQTQDDRNTCFVDTNKSFDARVHACTNIINSKQATKQLIASALDTRAGLYADKNDYLRATEDFALSLKLDSRAGTYFQRGNMYWMKGIHDKANADEYQAIADFTQAIRLTPITPDCFGLDSNPTTRTQACVSAITTVYAAYHNRSHVYAGINDFNHAIADYTIEIESHPEFYLPRRSRAGAFLDIGDYDRAIDDFNESLQLYPKDDEAYLGRANAFLQKGTFDRAIDDFSAGLKLAENGPNHVPTYNAKFYLGRAKAYQLKKDFTSALADYENTLQLDPQPQTYVVRGALLLQTGNTDRAIADYNEAIRLDSSYALAWNNRCWAEVLKDQLALALKDCNESLRLKPDNEATLDSRALVYLKIGNLEAAISDYDAALKVNPKFASSLYGRGLVKNKKENGTGNADIAAALALSPDITKDYAGYGIK